MDTFNKSKSQTLFSKIGPKFCQLAIIPFQKIAKNPFETLPPLGKST